MLRVVCTALLAALVVSGCSGGSDKPEADGPPGEASSAAGSPSPTATSTHVAIPPAPARKACYRLRPGQLASPTNSSSPVPCDSPHTSRTIFVGTLDTVVNGHSVAVDSAVVKRQLAGTCPRRLASYVGGTARTRDLSRFAVVWYSPTLAQSDRGADWFRCDVVAFSGTESLFPLPRRPPGVRGVLDRPGALDTYGLCGTTAPGARGFERVICGRPHAWRAFDTIGLRGGDRYPGARRLRATGDGECKSRAAARAADALRFRYGWEWPTRRQWDSGQRFGYCWSPA